MKQFRTALLATIAGLIAVSCGFSLQRAGYELSNGGRSVAISVLDTKIYAPTLQQRLESAVSKAIRRHEGIWETSKIYSDLFISLKITDYRIDVTNEVSLQHRISIASEAEIFNRLSPDAEPKVRTYRRTASKATADGFLSNPERDEMLQAILNSMANDIIAGIARPAAETQNSVKTP